MAVAALLSAFMSNTGATAALMPAVVSAAWSVGSVPSKTLMPLAYATSSGGLLTLMGTPPNIIVADTLSAAGLEPFGFFEFGLIGLPLLLISVVYMAFVGVRLLPNQTNLPAPEDLTAAVGQLADAYSLHGKIFRLRVRAQSSLAGKTLAEAALGRNYEITVLRVERARAAGTDAGDDDAAAPSAESRRMPRLQPIDERLPEGGTVLQAGDVLLVRSTAELVQRAMLDFNFGVQTVEETEEPLTGALLSHEIGLAEVLVTPRSTYIGQTLAESRLLSQIRRAGVGHSTQQRDRQAPARPASVWRLASGARPWQAITRLADERRDFVVVGQPEALARQVVSLNRDSLVAGAVLLGMVVLMVSGLTPTVIAALIAAVAMVVFGCLNMEQAYRAISWSSVVLIAAMIPMSTALQVTGGAEFLASHLVATLGVGAAGADDRRLSAYVRLQPGDQQHSHHRVGGADCAANCACPGRLALSAADDGRRALPRRCLRPSARRPTSWSCRLAATSSATIPRSGCRLLCYF